MDEDIIVDWASGSAVIFTNKASLASCGLDRRPGGEILHKIGSQVYKLGRTCGTRH